VDHDRAHGYLAPRKCPLGQAERFAHPPLVSVAGVSDSQGAHGAFSFLSGHFFKKCLRFPGCRARFPRNLRRPRGSDFHVRSNL
jgi:hypothetical protein